MRLEIREVSQSARERRMWEVHNEHGETVAVVHDEEFVKYLEDAEIVNHFVEDAIRTEARLSGGSEELEQKLRILHVGMGLCTETGEFMDSLKKHNFYGAELDLDNLDEEIGDVLWYLGPYCDARGTTIPELMAANIRKLRARYPEKFTKKDAMNRDTTAEDAARRS